ncbi:MAG: tail fiber domain-containing protein [Ignavibacteria bacterium]
MKRILVLFFCFISVTTFSQNITNTLGANGVFTIKDGSTNFLTLSQLTGQVNILNTLRLANTTSSTLGVLFKGTDRFLHNYGTSNTFLGINSGNFTMTGYDNTGFGSYALLSNTSGYSNTALGTQSLFSNNGGWDNTALGNYSLYSNSSGYQNTALGSQSLYSNISGTDNTAVGRLTLGTNTTGSSNTSVGNLSLFSNDIGSFNTAVGFNSLNSNTSGNQNTAVGLSALHYNFSGSNNTAVGETSLFFNSTGNENTALGKLSGVFLTSGSNNTLIGYFSQPSSGTVSNQITLGDGNISSLRCNVQTITSLSDRRDKKNITDLPLGLDFLMKIKPRLFNWDKREWYDNNISDGSKMNEAPTAGFIAQELDEVQTTENAEWLNLVMKDNPEKMEATSGNLLPVMVKAIQELKTENDLLKQNNNKLSSEVELLKAMNEKIVKLEKIVNELTSVNHDSNSEKSVTKIISHTGDVK